MPENHVHKKAFAWAAGIIAVVVVAFGLWWFAAREPLSGWTGIFGISPAAATTTQTASATGTSALGGKTASDVKSIVAALPDSSEFQSLFNSTGVAAMIKPTGGQYTIFVPTNGAFADLPKGTISNMTAAQLKRLVEYHVVSGKAIQADTEIAGAIQALSGDPLNFSDNNNIPMVGSAILVEQYKATNGVVYVINNVLIPPQK